MKASESNAHFASRVRESSNFAVREIKKLCSDAGPRPAGSENEEKAHNYIKNLMSPIADEVRADKIDVRPKVQAGVYTAGGIMMIISSLLMIFSLTGFVPAVNSVLKPIACILTALTVVLAIGGFRGKNFAGFLFGKAESENIICIRKSLGETKKRVIISGNIDSPYEKRFGDKVLIAGVISLGISAVIDFVSLFDPGKPADIVLLVVQCIAIPGFVICMFTFNTKVSTDGASNNLSGTFASFAVIKYLRDNDVRFENTEVVAAALGGSNCEHSGAESFARGYSKEFEDGAETFCLCLDSLKNFEKLTANGDETLKKSCENAEYDIPFNGPVNVKSDGYALQKYGLKTAVLCGEQIFSGEDKPSKLDIKAVEAGIKIALETVFLFDEK